jgi:hypothetical protein
MSVRAKEKMEGHVKTTCARLDGHLRQLRHLLQANANPNRIRDVVVDFSNDIAAYENGLLERQRQMDPQVRAEVQEWSLYRDPYIDGLNEGVDYLELQYPEGSSLRVPRAVATAFKFGEPRRSRSQKKAPERAASESGAVLITEQADTVTTSLDVLGQDEVLAEQVQDADPNEDPATTDLVDLRSEGSGAARPATESWTEPFPSSKGTAVTEPLPKSAAKVSNPQPGEGPGATAWNPSRIFGTTMTSATSKTVERVLKGCPQDVDGMVVHLGRRARRMETDTAAVRTEPTRLAIRNLRDSIEAARGVVQKAEEMCDLAYDDKLVDAIGPVENMIQEAEGVIINYIDVNGNPIEGNVVESGSVTAKLAAKKARQEAEKRKAVSDVEGKGFHPQPGPPRRDGVVIRPATQVEDTPLAYGNDGTLEWDAWNGLTGGQTMANQVEEADQELELRRFHSLRDQHQVLGGEPIHQSTAKNPDRVSATGVQATTVEEERGESERVDQRPAVQGTDHDDAKSGRQWPKLPVQRKTRPGGPPSSSSPSSSESDGDRQKTPPVRRKKSSNRSEKTAKDRRREEIRREQELQHRVRLAQQEADARARDVQVLEERLKKAKEDAARAEAQRLADAAKFSSVFGAPNHAPPPTAPTAQILGQFGNQYATLPTTGVNIIQLPTATAGLHTSWFVAEAMLRAIPKFTGQYHEYPMWVQLAKKYAELPEIPVETKLTDLKAKLEGRPAVIVSNVTSMDPSSLQTFFRELKREYGDIQAAIATQVRRMEDLKSPAFQYEEMHHFYTTVKCAIDCLRSLGVEDRSPDPYVNKLVRKLPPSWRQSFFEKYEPEADFEDDDQLYTTMAAATIDDLLKFLRKKIHSLKRAEMAEVQERKQKRDPSHDKSRRDRRSRDNRASQTKAKNYAVTPSPAEQSAPTASSDQGQGQKEATKLEKKIKAEEKAPKAGYYCDLCEQKGHTMPYCGVYKAMKPVERLRTAIDKRVCFGCISGTAEKIPAQQPRNGRMVPICRSGVSLMTTAG